MKIIDMVLFARPSFKMMGVDERVTTLASSQGVIERLKSSKDRISNYEDLLRVIETEQTTIANYDKIPQQIKGLVVHEEGSTERYVVSTTKYEGIPIDTYQTQDGQVKVNITPDGVKVSNIGRVFETGEYDFIYGYDKHSSKEIVTAADPAIKLDGKTYYLRARILAPTLMLKEKYKSIQVNGYFPFIDVPDIEPKEVTRAPMQTRSIGNINPILINAINKIEKAGLNSSLIEKELSNITEADKQRFNCDNEYQILACKIVLGEVEVKMIE